MRISDWSSDVCSSDLPQYRYQENQPPQLVGYQASNMVQVRFRKIEDSGRIIDALVAQGANQINGPSLSVDQADAALDEARTAALAKARQRAGSEEHTSELQSLMRISYAVLWLKKKQ